MNERVEPREYPHGNAVKTRPPAVPIIGKFVSQSEFEVKALIESAKEKPNGA